MSDNDSGPIVQLKRQYPLRYGEEARSWLGGKPFAPAGFKWPSVPVSNYPTGVEAGFRYPNRRKPEVFPSRSKEVYLPFICQICCADLPKDLWDGAAPKTGWLLFFDGAVFHTRELGVEHELPESYDGINRFGAWVEMKYDETVFPQRQFYFRRWPVDMVVWKTRDQFSDYRGRNKVRVPTSITISSYENYVWLGFSLTLKELIEKYGKHFTPNEIAAGVDIECEKLLPLLYDLKSEFDSESPFERVGDAADGLVERLDRIEVPTTKTVTLPAADHPELAEKFRVVDGNVWVPQLEFVKIPWRNEFQRVYQKVVVEQMLESQSAAQSVPVEFKPFLDAIGREHSNFTMGGEPIWVQYDMPMGDHLLLQLDLLDRGMGWRVDSMAYFGVSAIDLLKCDFSRLYATYQGS